jgi:hypothetical protein
MSGSRPGISVFMALALPLLCHADITLTYLDSTDTLQFTVNGGSPTNCGGVPESCLIENFFGGYTNPSTFALLFNIYDPGGLVLSDTLQITGTAGTDEISTNFQSDIEGIPLVPLVGGRTMIETGAVQTAASIPLTSTSLGNFVIQFQSDIDPVPEPRYIGLLSLGMVGMALAARKRWSREA